MELHELVEQADAFDTFPPREKIKLFAWWTHVHGDKELFGPGEIRTCFNKLHLDEPPALATYLSRMADGKDLIKERDKYKLARGARSELDKKYGVHQSVISTSKLLSELRGTVPDLAERNFLDEAFKCYRLGAFRACIVMTWNLAYSHLLHWLLTDPNRLAAFNTAFIARFPKKAFTVTSYDSFEDIKEFDVIEVCSSASLLNGGVVKTLKEKLGRRNTAAHPSSVVIVQSQADDVVTDLVNNVVLALT